MTKSVKRGRSTNFKILLMTNDPHHMYVKLVPQHSIPHYTNKVKKRVLISSNNTWGFSYMRKW